MVFTKLVKNRAVGIQYPLSLPYLNVRFSLSVMPIVNQMEFEPKGLFILFYLVDCLSVFSNHNIKW